MLQSLTSVCREYRADLVESVWVDPSGATESRTVLAGRTRLTAVRVHCPYCRPVMSVASGSLPHVPLSSSQSVSTGLSTFSRFTPLRSRRGCPCAPTTGATNTPESRVSNWEWGFWPHCFLLPNEISARSRSRCGFNGVFTTPHVAICGEPADGNVHLQNEAWLELLHWMASSFFHYLNHGLN